MNRGSDAFDCIFVKVVDTKYDTTYNKGGSSHCTFRKRGRNPITIPKHRPIKKIYVELVKHIIESEDKEDENN